MDSLTVIQMAEWWVQAKEPQQEPQKDQRLDSSMDLSSVIQIVERSVPA